MFTLINRYFYPTSAVPSVSFLILHPREMQILWSQAVRQEKNQTLKNQGRQIHVLAYRVREHNKKTPPEK